MQTATRLLNEISRKALNLDAHPLLAGLRWVRLGALQLQRADLTLVSVDAHFAPNRCPPWCSAKLEAADGRQSSLEAAVGDLKAGLAQQGSKLDDIANACAQLLQVRQLAAQPGNLEPGLELALEPRGREKSCVCGLPMARVQAVQLATGASSSMEERLQALLAKEPCVTGGGYTPSVGQGVASLRIQPSTLQWHRGAPVWRVPHCRLSPCCRHGHADLACHRAARPPGRRPRASCCCRGARASWPPADLQPAPPFFGRHSICS